MSAGSGINVSTVPILVGAPVFENQNKNITLADAAHPAFAIAFGGAAVGGVVSYRTLGYIDRSDWEPISGTRVLVPNTVYFLNGAGQMRTSGMQRVGVAQSSTRLRIDIQAVTEPPEEAVVVENVLLGNPEIVGGTTGNGRIAYDNRGRLWVDLDPDNGGNWTKLIG